MTFLTPQEKQTLTILCDTLIPTLQPENGDNEALFRLAASDLGVPELVEDMLARVTNEDERKQIKMLLKGLENGFVNGVIARQWCPISEMPLEAREQVMYKLATSPLEQGRTAFLTIKRLTTFIFYSLVTDDQHNPTWESIGYRPPHKADPTPRPITPLEITEGGIMETDVLVIGSGAGGGVVAGELATAGYDVMVVEKGNYYTESDFDGVESRSMETMYEKYGAMVNDDATINILAGSVLGGGTTINWAASFRTPDYVLDEWEHVIGFTGATGQELQNSFDAVSARINVGTEESWANPNNSKLVKGCQELGYEVGTVPRNVKGCEDCSFCNYGCSFGAKQSTVKTYLQDAHDAGARIIVRGHVDRVLHQNGKVTGAMVTIHDNNGTPHVITVRAKVVVLSAGTLHTPAIMMRSGLRNPNIGANLHLHPTTVISGIFDEQIFPWQGPPIARSSFEFANLDGNGYGAWLENAPSHPGLYALANTWQNPRQHKQDIQQLPNLANIIILTRDRDSGCITVDKTGQPVVHYRLSPYDATHLMYGMKAALRILVAAGAKEVSTTQNRRPTYVPGANGSLEDYLAKVDSYGLKPNAFALFSAHQMCSARIGGDPARGALSPTGESYEVENLFVADGSALPSAPGVNPMLSIMAVSHYIAQNIKAVL